MRTSIAIIAFGLGALALEPAHAATEKGDFAVYGWGARSCKAVIGVLDGAQADQVRAQLAEWAAGYVTAHNRLTPGTYDVTPVKNFSAFTALTAGVCRNNPDALFENVVNAVMATFAKLKATQNSAIAELENEGRRVFISADALKKVQQFLTAQGLLDAKFADGAYGPRTREALVAFQKSHGLTETGLPDIVTLFTIAREME